MDAVLLAPLVAAWWAVGVGEAARSQGVDVAVHPLVTPDLVGITAEVVRADRPRLRGLPEWLLPGWFDGAAPSLAPPLLARLRKQSSARVSEQERMTDEVRRRVFAAGHRYGIGHAERVAALTHADAGAVQSAALVLARGRPALATSAPPNAPSNASSAASPTVLPSATAVPSAPNPARPPQTSAADGVTHHTYRIPGATGSERVFYVVGTPGVALGSPWKFPLHVAWSLIGGREGLLDRRLRKDRALTYSLAAFSRESAEGGYGICFAECRPGAVEEVAGEVRAAFAGLAADISDPMLRSARERLIIRQHAALQTERDRTERLCGYELAGVGLGELAAYPDRIAAVTAEDVRLVASVFLGVTAESTA